jgi:hypothetical protein
MSPSISPSTWTSPLEVTLPLIVKSSPMIDGTILLALGLLEALLAGRSVKGVVFASPPPTLVIFSPDSGFVVNIVVPSIANTEMQRPATHRRQVRNLRHANPLTGIVAELRVEGQHPNTHSCQKQYRLA